MNEVSGVARRARRPRRRRIRPFGWVRQVREEQRREIMGVLMAALALLLLYSLYNASPGWAGSVASRGLRMAFGEAAPLAAALLGIWGVAWLTGLERLASGPRLAGGALILGLAAAFYHVGAPVKPSWDQASTGVGGGLLGAALDGVLTRSFGPSGRTIVLYAFSVVAALLVTGGSIARLARSLRDRWLAAWGALRRAVSAVASSRAKAPARTKKERAANGRVTAVAPEADAPLVVTPEGPDDDAAPPDVYDEIPAEAPPAAGEGMDGGAQAQVGDGAPGPDDPVPPAGPFDQLALHPEALYQLPSPSLLTRRAAGGAGGRRRDAADKRRVLEQTLRSFGVEARVVHVEQGPAVTRFEVQPGPGVKVSRIASLADDIALSMAAAGVRIVAPIPGKAAMGIEVPNAEVETVHLRDVLESREFRQSASRLTVALGQDISGQPVVSTLERMVHLLVAGATGSGKSVCVNTLLCSLLFKASPAELRLLLIDPKVVELSAYNGTPHLLTPVITDPRRAAGSLRWLVKEMEKRYESFAQVGARDIGRYNQEASQSGRQQMPYIVVVIDELADLMMVAPAEVEDTIQRLAQMARAAGIHLVVATQRPSVDVITGVIKANIPSRIAFAVSSQVDSRTILDVAGAEKLLGKGDMLFHPLGAPKPLRVQGAYIPEGDLDAILAHVRRQGQPTYRQEVLAEAVAAKNASPEHEDELLPEAVRVVLDSGQASVSIIQRRLRVGYTRAGRLIDMMEERGIVGPHQGPKPREILITAADYRRFFGDGEH